ncbi:hypothetical protein Zmor_020980 [Zophobas morio]|uniref:Dynein attachment factor N-terminal domain-containing protein n=1 Tax=Zophobas morio TaxID=2755281 RepID=A0AA38I7G7_9CUCU|nr:hypothetical protein Zmor_020980 [Zophobas morio]
MATYKINQNKLLQELVAAVAEDKMYWVRNDAKIRAATTSKSYDEFRDIVAAAHLQPIKNKDKERRQRSWNTLTDGN